MLQPAGEEVKEEPAPNRFSAVIEKIERLYMVSSFIYFVFCSLLVAAPFFCLFVVDHDDKYRFYCTDAR